MLVHVNAIVISMSSIDDFLELRNEDKNRRVVQKGSSKTIHAWLLIGQLHTRFSRKSPTILRKSACRKELLIIQYIKSLPNYTTNQAE